MKRYFVLGLLTLTGLFSCEKKEQESCEISVASIAGKYKIVSILYYIPGTPLPSNIYTALSECQKDDFHDLKINGNLFYIDAGIKCSPSNDASGSWSLLGNTLTLEGHIHTIESFDCNFLVTSISDAGVPGDKKIFTFKKQ